MPLPTLEVSTADLLDLEVDALVVPVFRGAFETPGALAVRDALGLAELPRDAVFRGKVGELQTLAAPGLAAGLVVLVGLGRMDELSAEVLRRAAGAASRHLADRAASVATSLALVQPEVGTIRAVAEGALLGAYRYDEQRSLPRERRLTSITLLVPAALGDEAAEAVATATVHARAEALARDLVNVPPGQKTPPRFVERVREALPDGIEVEVWDESRLAEERCGGVLAVGGGSAAPPRMLILRYRPEQPIARVALVGKGITFDTGGISLKRPSSIMEHMKADMAGAAAVVAAVAGAAWAGGRVEILGICGVAENAISGSAQRPSDVIRIRNGLTVEVENTDAEGRLVLADGLSYAVEHELDAVVDVATLTGAAKRAVGARAIAAFGNDDDLLRQLLDAAESAGEAMWHMPLWEDLRENLESEVADLNNLGRGDEAHATTAGLFLREFVDHSPWVHLDIAGPAFVEKARHHLSPGGTGAATRTLLRWLEQPVE